MNLKNFHQPKRTALFQGALFLIAITTASVVYAQTTNKLPSETPFQVQADGKTQQTLLSTNTPSSLLSRWWNGPSALDQWFGLGPILSAHGLTVTGSATERYLGQVSGGYSSANQPQSNFINEEKLNALLNFAQLFGNDALNGLTFSSTWRYRNVGSNPGFASGTASGPSSTFNPSALTTGLGVRILPQYLQYTTPNNSFTINAGWENPFEQFLQQPLSKEFDNNAIATAKGIGATLGAGIPYVNTLANPSLGQTAASGYTQGNATGSKVKYFSTSGVPWSSSYAAWGATLKVKPSGDTYVQSGLYEAITQANGIPATQFSATQVYPYTQVPASLAGAFNSTGLVYQKVGANGQLLYNKNGTPTLTASGFIPGYNQNHGFNFQGSPSMNVNTAAIGSTSVVNQNTGAVTSAANYGSDGGYNSMNGLYNVNEIGWTPKFGSDKSLEGHYAIGGYIWGQENTSFTPVSFASEVVTTNFVTTTVKGKSVTTKNTTTFTPYNAKTPYPSQENNLAWGMYFQADQRLYAVKEQVSTPSLDDKNPATTSTRVTDKGLYMFNEFTFTTPENNVMPFYFQTGLVYKGLIPHRDNDSLGIALGTGFYSSYYNQYIHDQNQSLVNALGSSKNATVPNGPTTASAKQLGTGTSTTEVFYGAYLPVFSTTEVIEAYYKIQINKWASISPDAQYIINPAGNATLGNEWILGATAKVAF